ncbi:serine-rich adhesin for platelets [Teleopsis dalmanni]|uniref:serine-rich adhesin for platelets n=1 Tax=Teleopsis dalmanni TaxID=139649 RepID=UPI0018CE767F|nr:serine-rich adhesin for platelets [Teleopsis dalmanni]XP_037958778.1 serine-rich adhesin for platelets [Teleopsis dalmanni]
MAIISRRATASSSSSSTSSASTTSLVSLIEPDVNKILYTSKSVRSIPSDISHKGNNAATETIFPDTLHENNVVTQFTTATTKTTMHNAKQQSFTTTIKPTTIGSNIYGSYTAHPTLVDIDGTASTISPFLQNETERDRIRAEFFATYDVMTGVRIAATLGGFFGLMVFLIVWKSRSSSNETLKVLKDPKMAAVAAVCMQEEEEREIQEAMVATGMSIYPDEYDAIIYRRQRMLSLGNVSAPPMLNRGYRFSSVGGGGYSSLLEPPRRFSYSATSGGSLTGGRRKSGSETSRILSNYPMGSSFGTDDYFIETEDELDNGDYVRNEEQLEELNAIHRRTDSTKSKQGFLEVPLMGQDSRRSSAMTCCSTESSYLERRYSAFTLGLSNLPPSLQRKLSVTSRTSSTDNWDYYYPDIQVIQPTPKPSPCPSERSIYEQLQVQVGTTTAPTTTIPSHTLPTVTTAIVPATPIIATATTAMKTSAQIPGKIAKPKLAANWSIGLPTPPTFVRKQSIAYYDPTSAQAGRKQQIHSISADTVDIYPLGGKLAETSNIGTGLLSNFTKPIQSAPPASVHQGFNFSDSPIEELRLNVHRKIAVIELHRPYAEQMTPPPVSGLTFENNNSYPYTISAAAIAAANAANSSSISMDSNERLNGSGSFGTASAKTINVEKRAPLASLSSFKISSLEYQDSEMGSIDDDSVFIDSAADTDEDMQQLSSDSEEASLGVHDTSQTNEKSKLVASAEQEAPANIRHNQHIKHPIEKRFSLVSTNINATTASRVRKPLLQRHRTISVSSSDRVSLIGPQSKEIRNKGTGSGTQTPTTTVQTVPLETHFGTVICTNSPPMHSRRAQLLQQYSDPHSLPTTTTTTTNTEDDTCPTLNTEICTGADVSYTADIDGGGGSTTQTQHSSLNTIVSIGRISPLSDNNNSNCSATAGTSNVDTESNTTNMQTRPQLKQQLPRSRLADDPCVSSISDSIINTRQPIICMPSSLKSLILRGTTGSDKLSPLGTAAALPVTSNTQISKSATNLSLSDTNDDIGNIYAHTSPCPSVMLELPLIKLPTDDSSESSTASDNFKYSRSKSDDSRDPSLPGSSRKWSKETLF